MLYRVHQFLQALVPQKLRPAEVDWIQNLLPPKAIPLFFAQTLADQRHALDVTLDLSSLPPYSSSRNLLIAALLHDCGKSRHPLKIWERVYIVLAQKLPKNLWNALLHFPSFLANPLQVAENHPLWGAELAHQAGLDPEIVELIRNHHCPQSPEERLLNRVDNRH